MATPPEIIQNQHDQATEMIRAGIPFAVAQSTKEIPLSQKVAPFFELVDNGEDVKQYSPVWTTRGYVDVNRLQSLVTEGYNLKYDQNKSKKKTLPKQQEASKPTQSETVTSKKKQITNKDAKTKKSNPGLEKTKLSERDVTSVTNLWDPVNAAVHNVSICRPSHDAWGIHKIVLLFCDDFVQRRYVLPWWHQRSDIREAVQPILDVLDINSSRVVRMLLASLPPGVTIPVHEDSGAWVGKTHRVHVPIIVKNVDDILFRCGATVDTMERISTEPGHVFEMNNQAKHAVSNCSTDYRVHLILDYVDEDYEITSLPQINLDPGEVLVQTRRSIDRFKDRGTRPTPSFMIIGAQKAGTTSLYEYMVQHPLVVRAKRRETHCLDWRWDQSLQTVAQQRAHCHNFYYYDEIQQHPSCLTGDSTPSYLIDSRRVIPRLKAVFPWSMKFFVMLRNPVNRAESHFAMVTSNKGTPAQLKARGSEWREKTFQQVVMEDLEKMQQSGLIPYWNIKEGLLDQDLFDSFVGTEEEDQAWDIYLKGIPLNTGSYSLLARGLYELNLRPWLRNFSKDNFLVLRLESFQSDGVSKVMKKVWKHIGLPSYQVEDESAKNTREYDSLMDQELRCYLERFYEPHNRRMATILGEEWKDVWVDNDLENCSP